MPDMIRPICCYDASGRRRISGFRLWLFFQDPSNRRDPQVQSCPAQRLGDLDLAHVGALGFQPLHDVADKIRELIHWLAQLQKCLGALVIDAFHPRCNRSLRNEKGVGRLFERPIHSSYVSWLAPFCEKFSWYLTTATENVIAPSIQSLNLLSNVWI